MAQSLESDRRMGRQASFLGLKVIIGFVADVAFTDVVKKSTDTDLNQRFTFAADFIS